MKPTPESRSVPEGDREISAVISELEKMDVPALQKRWIDVFGYRAPKLSRADLLRRGIAYAEQVKRYGGLDPDVQDRLRRLAEKNKTDRKSGAVTLIKGGTRLVREWRGTIHQVDVVDQDFIYSGRRYKSLSRIAREITGTAWSGPVFFGLKKVGVAS